MWWSIRWTAHHFSSWICTIEVFFKKRKAAVSCVARSNHVFEGQSVEVTLQVPLEGVAQVQVSPTVPGPPVVEVTAKSEVKPRVDADFGPRFVCVSSSTRCPGGIELK